MQRDPRCSRPLLFRSTVCRTRHRPTGTIRDHAPPADAVPPSAAWAVRVDRRSWPAPRPCRRQRWTCSTPSARDSAWSLTQRHLNDPALAGPAPASTGCRQPAAPGQVLRIPVPWLRLHSRQVRLLALSGQVRTGPAGSPGQWTAAREGMTLGPEQVLSTGADGSATLQVDDGSVLLLRPDSELPLRPVDAGGPSSPCRAAWTALRAARWPHRPRNRRSACAWSCCAAAWKAGSRRSDGTRLEVITRRRPRWCKNQFRSAPPTRAAPAEVVQGEIGFGNAAAGEIALGPRHWIGRRGGRWRAAMRSRCCRPWTRRPRCRALVTRRLRQIDWLRPSGAGPAAAAVAGPIGRCSRPSQRRPAPAGRRTPVMPDASGRLPQLRSRHRPAPTGCACAVSTGTVWRVCRPTRGRDHRRRATAPAAAA